MLHKILSFLLCFLLSSCLTSKINENTPKKKQPDILPAFKISCTKVTECNKQNCKETMVREIKKLKTYLLISKKNNVWLSQKMHNEHLDTVNVKLMSIAQGHIVINDREMNEKTVVILNYDEF
jgi:hypothetical protein